ncbi:MAG TPA: MlaD family protein [Methylibium sp.]
MSDTPPPSIASDANDARDDLPVPETAPRANVSLWLIWLIPLLAVAVGLGLAVKAVTDHGPTITIYFHNGDGLEAGKTHIKLRDVDVGLVKHVRLSPDLREVEVTAELNKGTAAERLLRRDTRFWVVRPRVGVGGVSGLGTLFSGSYIGVDAGRSDESATDFRGLDVQPPITADVPGRSFALLADDLGSLDIGSPVYFRRVPVGQVSSYTLDAKGQRIGLSVFVAAPYDRFVTPHSRFWESSGVDLSFDANGLRLETQSVASIIAGGIAFGDGPVSTDAPATEAADAEAPEGTQYRLYARRYEAMKQPDGPGFDYRLLLNGSVRGLSVGAPVEYRGLPIGEVTRISVEGTVGRRSPEPRIAVDLRVHPSRLPTVEGQRVDDAGGAQQRARLDPMVAHGFRAQLRTGNLLTGQLFVALDFFPHSPAAHIDWRANPPVMPAIPSSLDDLQETLGSLVHKLDQLPLDTLAEDAHRDLVALHADLQRADELLAHVDRDVTPALAQALKDAHAAMDDLKQVLGTADSTLTSSTQAIGEVQKAAKALRSLADTLERHPESLLRGKSEDGR